MTSMLQTTIYIGLNDADLHIQKFATKKYVRILKKLCFNYHIGFSFDVINGGYIHEDGTYVEERSLRLTLLDVPEETVSRLAEDLCVFFNQESVMITVNPVDIRFAGDRFLLTKEQSSSA